MSDDIKLDAKKVAEAWTRGHRMRMFGLTPEQAQRLGASLAAALRKALADIKQEES